mgnify:CR=1 FL=1
MLNLQYVGDTTKYPVNFRKVSDHIVQVTGRIPIKLSGFTLSRLVEDAWKTDYSKYNTVYREIDGGIQFSDDGSVYTAPPIPEPEPEPEPYIPTLEEIKAGKKQEIGMMYQSTTAAGIDVALSNGTQHFPLSNEDMIFLMGKKIELESGALEVSYQDSDNHCMFLSRDDMQTIIMSAFSFVNTQTTYRNNLYEWVDECTTSEEVEEITYGMEIPVEHQNEVYKRNMMQMEEKDEETDI